MHSRLAILGFHKIGRPKDGSYPSWNYVSGERFTEYLRLLEEEGWTAIGLEAFLQALSGAAALPARSVLITFDDGYRSTLTEALPRLLDFSYPAVVFVPTAYVGGLNTFDADIEPEEDMCSWEELAELQRNGVSVQAHGVNHAPLSSLDEGGLLRELAGSKAELENRLGFPVEVFADPYGDAGHPLLTSDLMAAVGYRAACLYGGGPFSFGDGAPDPYRIPRLALGPDSNLAALLNASAAAS